MPDLVCIGIDPGYDRLGWAIVTKTGSQLRVVDSGCVQTNSKADIYSRYGQIESEVTALLKKHKPQECSIESLFFAKNAKTAMRVSEAKGVILSAMIRQGIAIHEYTPMQIKLATTGSGASKKPEMLKMIRLLTRHEVSPKLDDEADAIAAAMCHCLIRKLR